MVTTVAVGSQQWSYSLPVEQISQTVLERGRGTARRWQRCGHFVSLQGGALLSQPSQAAALPSPSPKQ